MVALPRNRLILSRLGSRQAADYLAFSGRRRLGPPDPPDHSGRPEQPRGMGPTPDPTLDTPDSSTRTRGPDREISDLGQKSVAVRRRSRLATNHIQTPISRLPFAGPMGGAISYGHNSSPEHDRQRVAAVGSYASSETATQIRLRREPIGGRLESFRGFRQADTEFARWYYFKLGTVPFTAQAIAAYERGPSGSPSR